MYKNINKVLMKSLLHLQNENIPANDLQLKEKLSPL